MLYVTIADHPHFKNRHNQKWKAGVVKANGWLSWGWDLVKYVFFVSFIYFSVDYIKEINKKK